MGSNALATLSEVEITAKPCDGCSDISKQPVLDSSHRYLTYRFDSVARWIDNFFGETRHDQEAAYSFVRIRHDNYWQETLNYNERIKVRGKLRLPKLKQRLHLIFSDEDNEDDLLATETLDSNVAEQTSQQEVALEYRAKDKNRFRLDYKIGFRSSSELRIGTRARYELPIKDTLLIRLTDEVYWQDTRGFATRAVFDIDNTLSDRKLMRWSSRFDFTEDTVGLPWQSRLSLNKIINNKRALAYYFQAEGQTRPDYFTESYGPGVLYRVNVLKKWFFLEFEPRYIWLRENVSEQRKGVAAFTLRLEVIFSDKHTNRVTPSL